MALIICKDCKKEFSNDAKRCPHCGAKKPNKHTTLKGILIIAFVLPIISAIAGNNHPNTPESKASAQTEKQRPPEDQLVGAKYACREFIKKTLHDPDSAEFEPVKDYPAEALKNNIYHIQVTLRAKNGFGALRKFSVDCKVTGESDRWLPISLKEMK